MSKHIILTILLAATVIAVTTMSSTAHPEKPRTPGAPLLTSDAPSTEAADIDGWRTTCRDAMNKLGGALKQELQTAMKDGGPVNALGACRVSAVPIAETISTEEGLLVGRTSLLVRNPKNAPDKWEHATLSSFAARLEAGEKIKDLDAWTVVEDLDGHRTFRAMQAIGVMPLCLKCHGRRLDEDVAAKVAALYPEDAAVGYKAGELRGAFTVKLPLD